eukprot:symbB.v1.2.014443.t1/scaffold1054.1/size141114/15
MAVGPHLGDDDDEAYFNEGSAETGQGTRIRFGAAPSGEEDPLDAFMAEINSEIAKTPAGSDGFDAKMQKAQAMWEEDAEASESSFPPDP